MLVDGRQRPLNDTSCISKLCTVRARCARHPQTGPRLAMFTFNDVTKQCGLLGGRELQ